VSQPTDRPDEVFLNGGFVARSEAKISAFDAGVQHAVGLFETMRAGVAPLTAGGKPRAQVFRLRHHLDRLITSAKQLGLSDSLQREPLATAVEQAVERAGHARARVRLTITGGDLNLVSGRQSDLMPTILIDAQPATQYPQELFERGARVIAAETKANPLNPTEGHKTLNYWWRLRELRGAASKGADEALIFQVSNHLAGGCVSNAFLVKGEELITPIARGEEYEGESDPTGSGEAPKLPSPVLPGITRAFVLESGRRMGLKPVKRLVAIDDLLGADELFLTNSSFGVLPVVQVESTRIGSGEPGEVAGQLRRAWLEAEY
jgi:branched-subunit amino acid aminotransferase/4-amino-4-deoxychorismate lyase